MNNTESKKSKKPITISKKILVLIALLLLIVASYTMFFIIFFPSGGKMIYWQFDYRYLYRVVGVTENDELEVYIDNYVPLFGNHFYAETEPECPRDREIVYLPIPEKLNVTHDDLLYKKDDRSYLKKEYIHPEEGEQYGFTKWNVDYSAAEYNSPLELLEAKDGRKFVIYKRFTRLFIKEVYEK